MKKNKKGFTLVELLAVIVILIIILLIAINKIRDVSHKSKINALKSSALSYVKAVKGKISEDLLLDKDQDSGFLYVKDIDLKFDGKTPNDGYLIVLDSKVVSYCLVFDNTYSVVPSSDGSAKVNDGKCKTVSSNFEYKGYEQAFTAKNDGYYLVELWGAQGGSYETAKGGKGAYTSGLIKLNAGDTLYVYVGGKGSSVHSNSSVAGGYNGGGIGDGQNYGSRWWGSGGGATDVRLVAGSAWNDPESLASRIMVAAGGGGAFYDGGAYHGGDAGALTGFIGSQWASDGYCYGEGGTQTSGGRITTNCNRSGSYGNALTGGFGYGGNSAGDSAGGGAGYYGGSRSGHVASAGGGSSYISGFVGCISISSPTNLSPRSECIGNSDPDACAIHYSGKTFMSATMIPGNEKMPQYTTSGTMVGNEGNGYARISLAYKLSDSEYNESSSFESKFSGYDQLVSITSDGNQYINTHISAGNTKGVYAKLSSNNISSDLIYFGSRQSTDTRFWVGNNQSKPYYGWNTTTYSTATTTDTIQEIQLNYLNNRKSLNGSNVVVNNLANLSAANTRDIYIFAGNNAGTASYKSSIVLYELKISDGEEVIRDFVPCKSKSDDFQIGLCELKTGQFFGNSGTGSFVAGQIKNT